MKPLNITYSPYFTFTLTILCILFLGCKKEQTHSNIDISEDIYFISETDSRLKVLTYLKTLKAEKIDIYESYHVTQETNDLMVDITRSEKFLHKSKEEREIMASHIAALLTKSVDYADYYTQVRIYLLKTVDDNDPDAVLPLFVFPTSRWLKEVEFEED